MFVSVKRGEGVGEAEGFEVSVCGPKPARPGLTAGMTRRHPLA